MKSIQIKTGGESHGPAQTAILEGMPAGLELQLDQIARTLARRRKGTGSGKRMGMGTLSLADVSGAITGGRYAALSQDQFLRGICVR